LIDFRYYIVTIIAIFLALGLGVVAGTTVLDRVTVDTLRGQVDGLRDLLNDHRRQIRDLRADRDQANALVGALAPEVIDGALEGMRVVFVAAGEEGWHARVRDVIAKAGAEDVGSITLTSKWLLTSAADRDELIRTFGDRTIAERDPSADAATQMGELLTDVDGAALLGRLDQAGFVETRPRGDAGTFPLPTAGVVVLGSETKVPLAAFARGAARVTGTLAVAGDVDERGPVASLRRVEDAGGRLATFDSAADDPAGVGTVLALRAAADNSGGHFGRGRGLRYLPAPP
jgi:copper transport outer membrane protein MctB